MAKRSDDPRSWWMEVRADGQEAVTTYRVLGAADGRALIECAPQTGRTHQIRVHLAHIGCPIVGDPLYGPKTEEYSPLLLHARAIVLPFEGPEPVRVTAEPPAIFQAAMKPFNVTP